MILMVGREEGDYLFECRKLGQKLALLLTKTAVRRVCELFYGPSS